MASFSYINIKRVVKFFAVFLLVFASFLQNVYASDEEKIKDLKEKAIALYTTQNYFELSKKADQSSAFYIDKIMLSYACR